MRSLTGLERLTDTGSSKLPFATSVPADIQDDLLLQQAERLHAYLPFLCLIIAANALAMTLAVMGDLPKWQQFGPPMLIIGSCLFILARSNGKLAPNDPAKAQANLQKTTWIAGALGLVAGVWSVNAFDETEQYYCMVAPVFIGIAALVTATCLLSAPRAAIVGMVATVAPIIIKMMTYDYISIRAMAAMMVIVTFMQASVVLAKFRETVGIMIMQKELNRLAATDALTGLDNRHAFMEKLQGRLAESARLTLVLSDLDGFKIANDHHGHLAGDAILVEVGVRLRQLVPDALSIARLGGDEMAILFEHVSPADYAPEVPVEALRAAIRLPVIHNGNAVSVSASFGSSSSPADGCDAVSLLHAADLRLYADKAARRPERRRSAAVKASAS